MNKKCKYAILSRGVITLRIRNKWNKININKGITFKWVEALKRIKNGIGKKFFQKARIKRKVIEMAVYLESTR